MKYELHRSGIFGWLVGLASVPLVLIGFDVLVLPKVVTGYSRFIDRLAELTRLNAPGPNGSEEAWALLFAIAGTAMLVWSTKEMFAPRPVLTADDSGITFNVLGGPTAGRVFLPWDEVSAIDAVVLEDADGGVPSVRIRVVDARRLPSNPWGGEWVDGSLVLRANSWDQDPLDVAESLSALSIGGQPPAPGLPPRMSKTRVAFGAGLFAIAAVLALYLWLGPEREANWPFIPIAVLGGLGVLVVVSGFRQVHDQRFAWAQEEWE